MTPTLFAVSVVIAAAVLVAAARAAQWLPHREVVYHYERGVLFVAGAAPTVLEPGVHHWSPRRSRLEKLDMRVRYVTLPGQEVLTADQVGLRLTLSARYQVADPLMALAVSERYEEALYLELQLALREVLAASSAEDLLARRTDLGAAVTALAAPRVAALGLTLGAASVKDIMFPGEVRRAFSQVVQAKQEGLAALERARGETAALRSLANAARMIKDNPALLQLRMLQVLGEGKGNTVVWGPSGVVPLGQQPGEAPPSA